MNFLGHAFVTPSNDDLRFGNFIADAVKGNPEGKYAPSVVEGIRLHRKIDEFADAHPSYGHLRLQLPKPLSRFSGILGDMYFDHFLALNWHLHSHESLEEFTARFYVYMDSRMNEMPERTRYFYPFMRDRNWLFNYRDLNFSAESVVQLSKRRPLLAEMAGGGKWLLDNHDLAASLFEPFIKDVTSRFKEKFRPE